MLEKFKFCKVREVKGPTRGTEEAAGIDFYIPTNLKKSIIDEKCKITSCWPIVNYNLFNDMDFITLKSGQSVLIPSGIHVRLDKGYCLKFENKSGVASKKHVLVGACVTKSTIICTNKGKFIAETLTKEFIRKNNILVLAYNTEKNEYLYCEFDGFRSSGEKECIRLIFDTGEILECSEDHLIFTKNRGYILAKNLCEDDIV